MLYVDIPALSDLRKLNEVRADACVSLYVSTTPVTQDVEASRIEAGNLAKQAYAQLDAGGLDKRRLAALGEQLDDLLDDDEFWRFQANSLAIFATPDTIQTFRLANRLQPAIEVADRFLTKPLMRAITFPNDAFVLALSENDVRLIEIFPDLPPQRLQVPGLPKDAASAVNVSSLNNRTSMRRVMGSGGPEGAARTIFTHGGCCHSSDTFGTRRAVDPGCQRACCGHFPFYQQQSEPRPRNPDGDQRPFDRG